MFCLIVCIALIVKAFLKGDANGKVRKFIKHISLFALIWGFLGFMIGMIRAMDSMAIANDISTPAFAIGLRGGLILPTFGIIIFLIARLALIGLTLKEK